MTAQLPTAVFGGAFDPPHIGHALIISSLLNSDLVHEVIVVPSGRRADKSYFAPDFHRRAMTELLVRCALLPQDRISVATTELDNAEINGTYELLQELQRNHPTRDLVFAIGSDLLPSLPSWKHAEKLKKEVSFIALYRAGIQQVEVPGFKVAVLVQEVATSHSSSYVRGVIEQKGSLAGLVTSEVGRYITANGLYQSKASLRREEA